MTHIAVLWHHHQPDYRDPSRGRPVMPWTRLHALRGYRDLATALVTLCVGGGMGIATVIERV